MSLLVTYVRLSPSYHFTFHYQRTSIDFKFKNVEWCLQVQCDFALGTYRIESFSFFHTFFKLELGQKSEYIVLVIQQSVVFETIWFITIIKLISSRLEIV